VKLILITADLHYRKEWFEWMTQEAPRFEAVLIAGDFLDMFIAEPRTMQAREVQSWLKCLAEVTRVAICSGNHDNAGKQVTWDRAPVYQWLAELGQVPNIITDGCTRLLDDVIITAVPYECSLLQKAICLDRGASLRRSHPEYKWIVLHHVPPPLRDLPMAEEFEALQLLKTYHPDFFLSGHIHDLPHQPGNTWRKNIGETMVIAPGQLLNAPIPNHVILHLLDGEGQWVTS
jgi:Icc-related predicted phosphoesterase